MSIKNTLGSLLLGAALLGSASAVLASDTPIQHFKGLPAETLEQAVKNFSEANTRLEALLAKEQLVSEEIGEIHSLTYTLENALQKINADFRALEEVLEEVHVASERMEVETIRDKGRVYLDTARQVVP